MKLISITLTLGICLCSSVAFAKTRNCTADEKSRGDAYLLQLERQSELRMEKVQEHLPFGVPESVVSSSTEATLVNGGYIMSYDHDLRTSLWTAYHLTATDRAGVKGKDRVNCFRSDPRIETNGPRLSDYKEPIFDRGHMANDADLKDELIEQVNSYVLTNMSPQFCRFNRGVWLSAENLVRAWAYRYEDIYVITGAVFDNNDDGSRDADKDAYGMESSNGQRNVAVPSDYYKVLYRPLRNGNYAAIAMLLPNDNNNHGNSWREARGYLVHNIVTIEQVERVAGITLFPSQIRALIDQDKGNWDFSRGGSNMEYTCKNTPHLT